MAAQIQFSGRVRVTSLTGSVAVVDVDEGVVCIEIADQNVARILATLAPMASLQRFSRVWSRVCGQAVRMTIGGVRVAEWHPGDARNTMAGRLTGVPGLKLDAAALGRLALGAVFGGRGRSAPQENRRDVDRH